MNDTNAPRFTPQGLQPTPEQTAIQLAQNKVVLIDANAGAAKTTTLAIRIGEALARKLAPEQILALTFTPEARDVMRQRLREVGIPHATAARIAVLTFEDFAGQMLARGDVDDVQPCPHVRQLRKYALQAIARAGERYAGSVDGLDLRTHNIALSQFLDFQLTLKATMALEADVECMGVEDAAELLNVPVTDYLVTMEYERLRLGSGEGAQFRGPFDATYDLACALGADGAGADDLPAYRVVVCDELHDLNEATFRILNALIAQPQCFFVGAGDKDQVIHARLGASDTFLNRRFKEAYPQLVRYPLTHSYRHGPHLAYAMAEFKHKAVDSRLPLHTEIRQAHYAAGAADCAARVVAAIGQWKRDGLPLDGCAVLIRDRHQSIAIENALMQAGIGYRTPEMAGYLQRDEILFLRGMIAIALKDLAAVKSYEVRTAIVEALAIFAEVELSPQKMEQAKYAIGKDPHILGDFFSAYIDREQQGSAQRLVTDTVAYLHGVGPDASAAGVLSAVCERMGLETAARRIFLRPYDASVVARSVAGFVEAAAQSGQTLAQFWQALSAGEAFATRKREREAVLIECVANAKGKEFAHVILPFLETGEFPQPLCARGEEENLFYVAATRAKSRLTLLSPEDTARRSPFIAQMKLASSAAAADAALARNATPPPAAPTRYYLTATFHEKEQVKALGAEYDLTRRAWFVPPGRDLQPFARWLKRV
ncbi:ATP-dependent helicase [Duganella sp. FT3S]|uniref:DNA 3'-5' helicase n=1 Tax=Rugamonas fusca TaxID=2758568 RepID=A0A7W2EE65_9BURK|nr:ATP-dependent helicase [Rugamonas fusca]MBA5604015.1 ATP-dependent helicase [Rugamonas fusca]